MNLGIYIQVPFCQTKCTYCNFHTGVASPAAYAPYARAVEREIRHWRSLHSAAGLESPRHFLMGDADNRCHSEPLLGRAVGARALPETGEESAFDFNVAPGFSPASDVQPITGVVEPKKAVEITAFFRPEND